MGDVLSIPESHWFLMVNSRLPEVPRDPGDPPVGALAREERRDAFTRIHAASGKLAVRYDRQGRVREVHYEGDGIDVLTLLGVETRGVGEVAEPARLLRFLTRALEMFAYPATTQWREFERGER